MGVLWSRPPQANRTTRRRFPLRDGRGSAAVPSSFMRGDLGVVEDWLTAVNEGAVDRLQGLSHEQVDIVGPRGQGLMDRRVLGEWLARSGFRSHPLRWFCGADGAV